jgi:DNA (cytosine-5)-methyltransferase 1
MTQQQYGRHGWNNPLLLDLFCGAGGAAKGYQDAGFEVIGVDIARQPNFPSTFLQRDVMEAGMIEELVKWCHPTAIHASPPCQFYSPLRAYTQKEYPDLVNAVRAGLVATGTPWVIENVPQAPLINPIILCGAMFGLRLYRHRAFESSIELTAPEHPAHTARCARNGNMPTADQPFMTITGGKHSKAWQLKACEYMGTPWMETVVEVCEAIPPRYTQHVGEQLLAAIDIPPLDFGWMSLPFAY